MCATCQRHSLGVARKYLQCLFDREGKQKWAKNEEKEGEKNKKRREVHPTGLEFGEVNWNAGKCLFKGS